MAQRQHLMPLVWRWLWSYLNCMPEAQKLDRKVMPSHLEEYLDYYKGCDSPGYAVLVTGEWGTGKTFQVIQALEEDEQYYVSLFGLQTADDVHSAVLAAMFPKVEKTREFAAKLAKIGKDMGGLFASGGILTGALNVALRREIDTDRILVFDDLERCGLDLKDTLGIINMYVEHYGCRVVVIAHDRNLAKKFKKMKEKLFGQTIKVEPQVGVAFEKFCSQISNVKKRDFLTAQHDEIVGVFKASKVKSLRILKHIIEDLARLHEALDVDHLGHDVAMAELVVLFSALDIEVRNGRLSEKDITNRANIRRGYDLSRMNANQGGNHKKPPLIVANDKYKLIDLESNLLQDKPIIEMLINGRYNQELVRQSLNNSPHFLKPDDEPPWKTVINFGELEDDIVEAAFERMEKQFENHDVTNSGEMLHIFSLRLLMAENGVIKDSIAVVAAACKAYIDDLLESDKLQPRGAETRWYDRFEGGYGGYTYYITEAYRNYFKDITSHLIESRVKALEAWFPKITKQLLVLMATDAQAFLEEVSITRSGKNPYALIPVLAHIPVDKFVDAWLDSPKENWRIISYALRDRYEANRLDVELKAERSWLEEVLDLLEDKIKKSDGFNALRIKRTIPTNLRYSLEK